MKIISHRGNISGPDPELENNPMYITKALDAGFDVELMCGTPAMGFI